MVGPNSLLIVVAQPNKRPAKRVDGIQSSSHKAKNNNQKAMSSQQYEVSRKSYNKTEMKIKNILRLQLQNFKRRFFTICGVENIEMFFRKILAKICA